MFSFVPKRFIYLEKNKTMDDYNAVIKRCNPSWTSRIDMEVIETLSAIGFTVEQIAIYFKVPKQEFLFYYELPDSPLEFHYTRGKLVSHAKEGISMMKAAESGDNVTQAQRFDKLRKKVAYQNSVREKFFIDSPV